MPCLNEADTVEICVEKAVQSNERKRRFNGEVVDRRQRQHRRFSGFSRSAKGARIVDVAERGYGAAH